MSGMRCMCTSCTLVMLTTAGLTFATSVATSGVPGRTGGEANGAGACAAGPGGPAAPAECWQPAAERTSTREATGRSLRVVMIVALRTARAARNSRALPVGREDHRAELGLLFGCRL